MNECECVGGPRLMPVCTVLICVPYLGIIMYIFRMLIHVVGDVKWASYMHIGNIRAPCHVVTSEHLVMW